MYLSSSSFKICATEKITAEIRFVYLDVYYLTERLTRVRTPVPISTLLHQKSRLQHAYLRIVHIMQAN
jgi:hypothetical protein